MQVHRSKISAALVTGLLLSLFLSPMAVAEPRDDVPSIDVVRNRLNLTPEQQAKLAPLFEQRASQLSELRTRIGQASSRQEKRDLLRDGKRQAESFNKQVEGLLDVEQKQEWRELRSETREKLKEHLEEKRDSGS